MMLFGSNPSVYTLPGTWEAQPMVSTDVSSCNNNWTNIIWYNRNVTATVISMLALKGKRKRV
ncbi:MAG: hypothetical protein CM15mV1_2540 [uncultured marine virus]|nr:MAG: hypothetical protein CM15mV1_2540 [uncultured marine virus]